MKRSGLLILAALCLDVLAAQSLRVMTYNVRYPNPQDGDHVWEARRDLFMSSVRQADPDLIGTQELFKRQGDDIVAALPQFRWFGTSRRGNDQDEHMGVFYRADRVKLLEQGQFWLSETPDTPGSQSWGMSLPRMATWGLFEKDRRRFYLLNTHLAHRREDHQARLNSIAVIRQRMLAWKPEIPVIITGDFNAPAGGPVHSELRDAGFADTRALAKETTGPEGTFHGFKGVAGTDRIDWIMVKPAWRVRKNAAVDMHDGPRYPSDHFAVVADLEFPKR